MNTADQQYSARAIGAPQLTRLSVATARVAKAAFTAAAQAAVAGSPDAARTAQSALTELNGARAELQYLQNVMPAISTD